MNTVFLSGYAQEGLKRKEYDDGGLEVFFTIKTTSLIGKHDNGSDKYDAQFHNCRARGRMAEKVIQQWDKESVISLTGKVTYWKDKNGSMRAQIEAKEIGFSLSRHIKPKQETTQFVFEEGT